MITLQSDIWLVKEVDTVDLLEAAGMSRTKARRLIKDGAVRHAYKGIPDPSETVGYEITVDFLDPTFEVRVGKQLIIVLERQLSRFECLRLWLVRHALDQDWLLPRMGTGRFSLV
mgnify:CR=1 FL=1